MPSPSEGDGAVSIAGSLLDQRLPFLFFPQLETIFKCFRIYTLVTHIIFLIRNIRMCVNRPRDNFKKVISQLILVTEIQAKKWQSNVNTMMTCKMLLRVEFHWRFPVVFFGKMGLTVNLCFCSPEVSSCLQAFRSVPRVIKKSSAFGAPFELEMPCTVCKHIFCMYVSYCVSLCM